MQQFIFYILYSALPNYLNSAQLCSIVNTAVLEFKLRNLERERVKAI